MRYLNPIEFLFYIKPENYKQANFQRKIKKNYSS